ncbi:MAG TPA: tryptophan synthase subunit alpha [Acidimicrobiales bacterium]|jgi:tryptophan synthase alpha chain
MTEFFAQKPADQPGLALFLNAGDPSLDVLPDLLWMLDECRVDCVELAVPFPNSPTDGPVIRRSADRALANGVGLDDVLDVVGSVRTTLRHLRIALLADWSYTAKGQPLDQFTRRVADSGADGLLLHGLPPRLRAGYYQAARDAVLPIVTTCYHNSHPQVVAESAAEATAYLYLVAQYGRSGSSSAADYVALSAAIATVQEATTAPVAVGFGVRSAADVAVMHDLGADAAIVGTAAVAQIERAVSQQTDAVEELYHFARTLRPLDQLVGAGASAGAAGSDAA